jgi:hypothetical protein
MPLILARNRVIICLLFLMSILPSSLAPSAAAQSTATAPVLARAAAIAPPTMAITVVGHGFSPGGLVYVAIYDRWGVDQYNHVWVTATSTAYMPTSSIDPGLSSHVVAGSVRIVIDLFPEIAYGPNGFQDPAQGYTGGADAVQAPGAIYGPHGSQDPAQGYVPASDQAQAGVACGRDLMVRAYDQQAATWSNVVDVAGTC